MIAFSHFFSHPGEARGGGEVRAEVGGEAEEAHHGPAQQAEVNDEEEEVEAAAVAGEAHAPVDDGPEDARVEEDEGAGGERAGDEVGGAGEEARSLLLVEDAAVREVGGDAGGRLG